MRKAWKPEPCRSKSFCWLPWMDQSHAAVLASDVTTTRMFLVFVWRTEQQSQGRWGAEEGQGRERHHFRKATFFCKKSTSAGWPKTERNNSSRRLCEKPLDMFCLLWWEREEQILDCVNSFVCGRKKGCWEKKKKAKNLVRNDQQTLANF